MHHVYRLRTVKYLVEKCEADPNIKNKDGLVPLHIASRDGHLDIVKYLAFIKNNNEGNNWFVSYIK